MADNKIEILTSNAKQVINDYVLGTDTDFQKVENAIQELAENDISTLNWNSLENYPDRSHDYQFSYNNSDGTINIWDTESESYLSPSEFLLSEHSDRQMACDQYAQHRLQFLENTPEALRDCVSNIFQTLKDYHLDVTILAVPNKTGSLDGKDFFAFDVSGGREQIFHSQTGTSIGLKEFQETLEQLQFWDHEEDSTSDERINRILDAAADNPARLRMEVNFLFDDKIQPNGVDFDENASITWTIRGNHETETFILTRDPDTHEITAYEANHGVLNIEQLQEEASRIGVADVSLSNRVTSDEYTQLDHMQTMEKASAKATISAVTMERGLRGMGSLTWHMHGTNGQEDFSLDGNRDGSPIIRDKAGKEYDIDSMYNKLEDIGYFKTADPAPVDMYALPAREELPTYNSLFNFFPPEVRKNMDADEVKEIRASNPYYGIVDGIDMTRKTIPIHVDNATIRNLLGESYQDATIDRMSVSTQYGNYISIEGVKFGITDRIYLDGDITKKDGEKEHINAQYAIRADGVYVYSIGQDQVSSSHKIRIVTGNDAPEKMVPFDRLSLSHRKNWFANDVKARIERLEKGSPERLDQFKQTPMYKGYENYQKIQELLEESKTLVDSAKADGDKAIEELSPEKQKEYALAVHDYQEAVSAVEKIVETKFAAAVRDIVNNAVDEIKESVMLGGNMEKKFDFYADILESVRRDFLGSKSANQYDYIRKDMDVIGHPVERYRPIIDDILKSEKSYTCDEIKEKFMDLKENTMDKVEKNTPENSTADSEKSESGIEKNRQYNLMTRAEVNLEGQLHLTQEKVEALEVQAEKIASSKGTSIEVEKGNLIQETFEKIKPYLSGLKELQGKMEGMQDRIGDSRLLRSNTFYQDYKMQYDFCAKKALDLGAAYGKDQVIKNYISNNDLRMDRQEYYKTNYYTSLEQRILSGGQEGLEKYETENGKSYTYGTKYDLSAWEKVGNFFASTIFRPYFRNIEKTIDRDPHAKVAYETVPAVEKPEENPVDTSSMVSGGAQGGVTTENQAADGMDSKNSEESGALADEKKAEEEQHMDLKDAIERENQDTKDDAMVAEQTRMESQDNDQDNMTEAANSKDNSESVVNGEEVHEIPESDVLETAEISSADEDVTADFEISQSRDEPESDSGAMPESLDVQDRQEELLIGSVGEDHSDSDSVSTADAKNDTFEPTTDDATLERGESQAESPTIGSENANSFHEEYKAQFSDCLNAANALDDVLSQAIEDVFSDENLGYMDIVNAAADAITDHYNSDTPYSEAAESSADLVYEVTDLDGKPMDNMDTMAEKLQQNGLSAEHVDHLYELASDRYASPEEPFEQPDPYEGFMDLDSGVTDSVDRVDMSQSSSVDAQQKLDFYEPNQFLDQMSNDLDSYVQAIEHAENIGTDVPDTALSDIVGSSFSVDSLKSAIDLMEAEVKSTADDDRDAQETMDTDPVLSEDIPESSIEPEVDDSLDADEWRRYL